jgi:hypothetical protein
MNIEEIQKKVAGSLAIENAIPSDEGIKVTKMFLEGKISSQEAISKIIYINLERRKR